MINWIFIKFLAKKPSRGSHTIANCVGLRFKSQFSTSHLDLHNFQPDSKRSAQVGFWKSASCPPVEFERQLITILNFFALYFKMLGGRCCLMWCCVMWAKRLIYNKVLYSSAQRVPRHLAIPSLRLLFPRQVAKASIFRPTFIALLTSLPRPPWKTTHSRLSHPQCQTS